MPKTRSNHAYNLPAFDPEGEDVAGSTVSKKVQHELLEALGDSPISATFWSATKLLFGFPLYLMFNATGQKWYPRGNNRE